MAVAISSSPSHHHYNHHNSIVLTSSISTISPRQCSPLLNNYFNKTTLASSDNGPSMSTLSKRKRPTMLDIPVMSLGFSVPTVSTKVDDVVEEEDRDGFYSVCCKKGRRVALEDRFSAQLDVFGDTKQAIFGVFDGHGGAKAAEYASENLNKNILSEIISGKHEDNVVDAVKQGYMKTDSDFLDTESRGGSCCVVALITKGDLVVSNAGDCRAVMSTSGLAEPLTNDHRPSRKDEKDRVEANGGYIDTYNGVWRIQGSLAVSRAIGDRQLKQWVISEPETRTVKISPRDEFLILASDGLWEKVSNQEAVDIVHPLCIASDTSQTLAACKKLVDMAVSRGSHDDISVMIIPLKQYML